MRRALRRWTDRYCPSDVPRALLDVDDDVLPPIWADLAEQRWAGIHRRGGARRSGLRPPRAGDRRRELGRVLAPARSCRPLAAGLLARGSGDVQKSLLPGVLDGSTPACVAFGRSVPFPVADVGVGGSRR